MEVKTIPNTDFISVESDPIFMAWDKSTGIIITESQISDLQTYLTSETSHADVLVDGDFISQGIMLRGASVGDYSILADNSTNWNTAYGWGDHAGLYDLVGVASGLISTHESTYDHDGYDTHIAGTGASVHGDSYLLNTGDICEGNLTVDVTSTEAFLVRKDNDTGDVFTVDTVNEKTIINGLFAQSVENKSNIALSSGWTVSDLSACGVGLTRVGAQYNISISDTISGSGYRVIGQSANINYSGQIDGVILTGLQAGISMLTNQVGTHTFTSATGLNIYLKRAGANNQNIAITNYYGIYIDYNQSAFGAISVTNSYGIKIEKNPFTVAYEYGVYIDSINTPTSVGLYLEECNHANGKELFIDGAGGVFFRDSAIHIGSLTDGRLDFTADIAFDFNTGNVFISAIKAGSTQVNAGAGVSELWKTSGHATLPDEVIMIGV